MNRANAWILFVIGATLVALLSGCAETTITPQPSPTITPQPSPTARATAPTSIEPTSTAVAATPTAEATHVPLMLPTPNGVDPVVLRNQWPVATPPEPEAALSFVAVGNIILPANTQRIAPLFDPVASLTTAADLTFATFDSQVRDAAALKQAGFGVMAATVNADAGVLSAAGITVVASAPRYSTINGVTVAFIAGKDAAAMIEGVKTARAKADVVVVTTQGGLDLQSFAGAGADVIIGEGHIIGHFSRSAAAFTDKNGIKRDSIIAESLGDYVAPNGGTTGVLSAALSLTLDKHGVRSAAALPLLHGEGWLRLPQASERANSMAGLATQAEPSMKAHALFWDGTDWRTGDSVAYNRDYVPQADGTISKPRNTTLSVRDIDGWSGGYYPDKAPPGESYLAPTTDERIALSDGHLRVYRKEENQWKMAWQSKPEWDVQQVTFGDADNDGRREILFTLWKTDNDGTLRSHPFVYGYRKDALRPVWSGSAVPAPLREFALADLDSDDNNELVVLEGDYSNPQAAPAQHITILRWSGWVYEVLWRSPAGSYYGLTQIAAPSLWAAKGTTAPDSRPSTATPTYGYLYYFGS